MRLSRTQFYSFMYRMSGSGRQPARDQRDENYKGLNAPSSPVLTRLIQYTLRVACAATATRRTASRSPRNRGPTWLARERSGGTPATAGARPAALSEYGWARKTTMMTMELDPLLFSPYMTAACDTIRRRPTVLRTAAREVAAPVRYPRDAQRRCA